MTDIDIDFANCTLALRDLKHVTASTIQKTDGQRLRHPSGVYFQDIPVDPLDGMAAWEHTVAAEHGFFKIDLLNNSIYEQVRNEAHLVALLTTDPPWKRLDDPAVVKRLAQIGKQDSHFLIVQKIEPRSILDLAICIALIRPGKCYLLSRPRFEIERDIWLPVSGYYYKRSHAIAYAASIVVQFNLLVEQGL